MKRTALCMAVICALAMAGVVAKAEEPAKVAGTWEMTSAGRQGNTMTSTLTIKQDGAKITGTLKGAQGMETPFEGTVDGNKISFTVKRQGREGNTITIEYTGTVDGDKITGKRKMGEMESDWTAKKTA